MNRTVKALACTALLALSGATPANDPATSEAARIRQGEALMQEGNFTAAIGTLNDVVRDNPRSGLGYLRLGGAYMMNRDYRASIEAFQSAIGIDPANATAFAALGMSYMHMGNYGPAQAAFEQAIELDPSKAADIEPLLQRIRERLANGEISPTLGH